MPRTGGAMKDRGKQLDVYNGDGFADNFPPSEYLPCKKHPNSSSAGICAYCLTDKLSELVCPVCGEQRLYSSSCSCSEVSSNPNSSNTDEVGSVGRISFLIENEKIENSDPEPRKKPRNQKATEENAFFKRSNSISVVDDVKGGRSSFNNNYNYNNNNNNNHNYSKNKRVIWKIGRLFRKKRDHTMGTSGKYENGAVQDNQSEECMGVSRSRSLCSFRGNGLYYYDTEESGGAVVSAARASSVSTGGFMLDSAKRSCFSESEARISNFDCERDIGILDPRHSTGVFGGPNPTKSIFSLKEVGGDQFSYGEPGFIDLKLDLSDSKPDQISSFRKGGQSTKEFGYCGSVRGGGGGSDWMGNEFGGGGGGGAAGSFGFLKNGGSCRVTVGEREFRKSKRSQKMWRWFFRASNKLGNL